MAAAAASPDDLPHLPATPPRTPIAPTRYPAHLSRRMASEGPPRPLLQHRGTSHMYETLEDLLKEAGYKETRIFTPEGTQRVASSANNTPTKSSSSANDHGTVGGTVVKLLSTFIARHVDPESPTPPARAASKATTSNSTSTSSRALRHTMSAPQIPRRRGPGSQHGSPAPPSPSWLTSLFSPRTPPSTPSSQRRRPTTPRLVSAQSRAASSHVAVTITNVVCRPAPSRKGSTSSNRSSGSSRASSASRRGFRDKKDVPMLVCECDKDRMYSPSSGADADAEDADADPDSSDDEDEINLSRILIPAKRQHSIRSLRTVLLHHQQRRSPPTPHRRISSLNPSRDRPRTPTASSSDENSFSSPYPGTSPDATPRPHRRYALTNHHHHHHQSSLPARITRGEPLHEEPASVEIETDSAGDGGEEGHWDSGEFMNARIKRRRSGLPRGWTAWGR